MQFPKKKLETIREEHDYFMRVFRERLKEYKERNKEVDDEDHKTLIQLELDEYVDVAPNLILSKDFMLGSVELTSLREALKISSFPEVEIEEHLNSYGVRNTLSIMRDTEGIIRRRLLRKIAELLLDVVRV